MKTLLTLERLKGGEVLDRRRQYSRSFTIGLMQLLYIHHAQILESAPYAATDIIGALRNLDTSSYSTSLATEFVLKGTLRTSGPSGAGGIFIPAGAFAYGDSSYFPVHYPHMWLPGHALGLAVGIDGSAPSPTDYAVKQAVFHGKGGAVAPGSTMEIYNTGDNSNYNAYGSDRWCGAFFVASRGFRLTSVLLKMYRTGSPGTLVISIRGLAPNYSTNYGREQNAIVSQTTDGNTLTNVSPGEWREVIFPSGIDVYPGIVYCIDLMAPSGDSSNYVNLRLNNAANHPRYGAYNKTGPTSYAYTQTSCPMFEARGSANPELEYGATEIFGLSIVNPNGQFNIRRLFTNNSGSAITVQECGIYAVATRYFVTTTMGQAYAHCIARDQVAPGVTVNNGEVLAVTYTPQITV